MSTTNTDSNVLCLPQPFAVVYVSRRWVPAEMFSQILARFADQIIDLEQTTWVWPNLLIHTFTVLSHDRSLLDSLPDEFEDCVRGPVHRRITRTLL